MEQYTVLVVDDMPENLKIIIDYLKESGLDFKILKAPNGKIACKLAENKEPDLIITDWEMPVMDGIEAIKWLKNNEKTKDIPIIVASGAMTLPKNVKTALEIGAMDYIKKPVDKVELVARVNSVLSLADSFKKIKLLNNELNETNKLLLSQREELTSTVKQLKETQSQLIKSEKMASMGILTAGIAHEINNPLNYIHGGETILKMYIDENLNDHLDDISPMLEMIETGVKKTSDIIQSLNKLKQSNDNTNSSCDLHLIIENCILAFKSQLEEKIEIVKSFTIAPYNLIGNDGELLQVFLNILTNSIHAIEEKGTITIETEVDKGMISVKIADTGKGIKKENLDKVTDPFFTTKPPGEGTGLGMSIAYNIIQNHKGSLEYESIVGNGTIVTVSFPI